MVPAWSGQKTVDELRTEAEAGTRPRTDYVELASALDADVLDMQYLEERATAAAQRVARTVGLVQAQVLEAFLRRDQYVHICARADRLGLPLALALKASRGRRDVVLVSAWLSVPKKAVFLSRLKVHSHLAGIVNYSSVQLGIARDRLGVPAHKLHLALQPVDERFFAPRDAVPEDYVCAVGSEHRDYPTLVRAARDLGIRVEIAVGSSVLKSSGDVTETFAPVVGAAVEGGLPATVRIHQQLDHARLRDLYARARVVVVPLQDVDSDCGVTAIAEAMAMAKPVVVASARGQVDLVRHGENGLYYRPGDAAGLRDAVQHLLDRPDEAERMGRAGRALVERSLRLDAWVAAVARVTRAAESR